MSGPLLLGHRGARKYVPENTIPALQLALDHGCDGFEFDVRLTSDQHAVICHDPKFLRLVVERTTRAQLEERCRPEALIPSLEEVLEKFSPTAFLNIELKVAGTEEGTAGLLRHFPPRRGCIVSSFLPGVVTRFHDLAPETNVGLICDTRRQLARWKDLPLNAVMLHRGLVSAKFVDELHSKGKEIFVWTVNSAKEMKKFAALGVDGIISDDTKLLAATLRPPL